MMIHALIFILVMVAGGLCGYAFGLVGIIPAALIGLVGGFTMVALEKIP
jgi:hypothetical protein